MDQNAKGILRLRISFVPKPAISRIPMKLADAVNGMALLIDETI